LKRFTQALENLGFKQFLPDYNYEDMFVTHGTYVTTTVWFGSGESKAVRTYAEQGPIQVWLAQQIFLSLLAEVSWTKERREARCDGI
jgi:hypothetical protein